MFFDKRVIDGRPIIVWRARIWCGLKRHRPRGDIRNEGGLCRCGMRLTYDKGCFDQRPLGRLAKSQTGREMQP